MVPALQGSAEARSDACPRRSEQPRRRRRKKKARKDKHDETEQTGCEKLQDIKQGRRSPSPYRGGGGGGGRRYRSRSRSYSPRKSTY